MGVSIVAAFSAGLVSFLAPCVLPLIPGFLSYLGGSSLGQAQTNRREIFLNSLFFVLGFSTVFAALGVLLNTLLEAIAYDAQIWLARIGGAVIIYFGFYLIGLIRLPWLEVEHKFKVQTDTRSRYLTSFLFGLAFAAGWTPCVGPALGIILGLAAAQPGSAFVLLLAYALGLGLPFLLAGLFVAQANNLIQRHRAALRYVNIGFGILLTILGVLVFTQSLNRVASWELLNDWLLK
jgi:cytochrome c-type biogenesis protein